MRTYSKERKEAVLKKLFPPINLSFKNLSDEEGIPVSTLYTWHTKYKSGGGLVRKSDKGSKNWSAQERFSIIVETSKLSELELGEYCREKGIYPEQIKSWKDAFISNELSKANVSKQDKAETQSDKKRIIALEKELRRKEKALAETAALLVLRKKLQAFYEEGREDD